MKYKIVEGERAATIERAVEELQKLGWRTQGGVSIAHMTRDGDSSGTWYAQALVLYEQPRFVVAPPDLTEPGT